jgi:hypothetical protein
LPSIDHLQGRGDAERLEDPQVLLGRLLRLPCLPHLLRLGLIGRHSTPASRKRPANGVDFASGVKIRDAALPHRESDIPRVRSRTARRAAATPTSRRLRTERRAVKRRAASRWRPADRNRPSIRRKQPCAALPSAEVSPLTVKCAALAENVGGLFARNRRPELVVSFPRFSSRDIYIRIPRRFEIPSHVLLIFFFLHEKDGFVEASRNLTSYRSENNFVELSK